MSYRVLEGLNKHRSKGISRRKRDEIRKKHEAMSADTTPLQDVALPNEDNIKETFELFQRNTPGGSFNESISSRDWEQEMPNGRNSRIQTPILPTNWNKRKLPDYRPGPVKVYTDEEIAQYMKEKENDDG